MSLTRTAPLTVINCTIKGFNPTTGSYGKIDAVFVESGDSLLFFIKTGTFPGRRYYVPETGRSWWADLGTVGLCADYRPCRPFNEEDIMGVEATIQGPDALARINEMAYDCPAIRNIIRPVARRYEECWW